MADGGWSEDQPGLDRRVQWTPGEGAHPGCLHAPGSQGLPMSMFLEPLVMGKVEGRESGGRARAA